MTVARQIFLSSEDATLLGNTYIWPIRDIFVAPTGYRFLLSLIDCQIPFSFYSTSDQNNAMRVNGARVVVPAGNYNVKQILAKLRELLGCDTSYDIVYNKVTLMFQNPTVLEEDPLTGDSLLKSLGFQGTRYGPATTFTSDSVVNLLGVSAIYLRTNFSTLNVDSRSQSFSPILAKVPANSTAAGVISYINRSDFKATLYDSYISTIAISLTDSHGHNVNLNGQPWQCTLQVEYELIN